MAINYNQIKYCRNVRQLDCATNCIYHKYSTLKRLVVQLRLNEALVVHSAQQDIGQHRRLCQISSQSKQKLNY